MSADGRKHISNVKFNETIEFADGDGTRPANTTGIGSIISGANLTHPDLQTPEILEAEADFSARYLMVYMLLFWFFRINYYLLISLNNH